MRELEIVHATNLEDFINAPLAVLVLAKTTCEACKAWSEELNRFLETDQEYQQVRFGKMFLDQGGLADFKRKNPWLKDVDVLPYHMIYRKGEPIKSIPGAGIERLFNRLKNI